MTMMKKLTRIGFQCAGQWSIIDDRLSLELVGVSPRYSDSAFRVLLAIPPNWSSRRDVTDRRGRGR